MEIKFYKKNLRWYADLPEYLAAGGEEADCEMVEGADTMLDWLTWNDYVDLKEITVEMTNTLQSDWDVVLTKQEVLGENGEYGCYYKSVIRESLNKYKGIKIWLCPVTLFVFNEYPDVIFISKIV